MEKNKVYQLEIDDIGNDGEGIGHIDGMAVFVKDTVIGDIAKIKIIKVKKNYAYGRLMDIITPSAFRVEPLCPKASSCGGCTLMHMSYDKQLEYKFNKVKNCLQRIGEVKDVEALMEPIIGMETPFNYRNKMQLPVRTAHDGSVKIGFFASRTHSIIDLEKCDIGHPVNSVIIKALRGFIQKYDLSVYKEETNEGLIRHILTRIGFTTNELMVCLIINGNKLPYYGQFVEMLEEAVDKYNRECSGEKVILKSISININKSTGNRILGDKVKTIWGQPYITDYIGDIAFQISPLSFYQVNPSQTKVLYNKALEYANLTGNEIVWDMYCGIGTISLFLANKAKKVYGVEVVPEAIDDAVRNAELNRIGNAKFMVGKAEEVVPDFYNNNVDEEAKTPDVIVVDPPRKGCDKELLDTILKMNPLRIVYVSCDPATLARDIKILCEESYELKKVSVVDQFAHSGHVETIVALHRTNS